MEVSLAHDVGGRAVSVSRLVAAGAMGRPPVCVEVANRPVHWIPRMVLGITPSDGSEAGLPHYCKGGVPGKYPTFDAIPHPMPFRSLYDPFGFQKLSKFKMSKETKERRLRVEINNGRLAMLGIFGFLSEQTIPGSVPLLKDVVAPYSGEVMAPFSGDFSIVLP